MSKISISVAIPTNNEKAAYVIHRITGSSINTAKKSLSMGKKGIFYTTELYLNDYPERAEEILELLDEFKRLDIELFIIEISHDESWSDVDPDNLDAYKIEVDILHNIVESTKDDYE